MYIYTKTYVYIILCGGGGLPWQRYAYNGHLIHVDQNTAQLLVKLSIFGGSLVLCLLYYRHMKNMYAWDD